MIILSDDLRRIIHPRLDLFISRETLWLALNRHSCALGHSRRTAKQPKFGSSLKKNTNTTLKVLPQFQLPAWNRLDRLTVIVNGGCVDGLLIVMLWNDVQGLASLVFSLQTHKSSTKNMRSKKHVTFQNIQKNELEMSVLSFQACDVWICSQMMHEAQATHL